MVKKHSVVVAGEGLTVGDLNSEAVILDAHSGKYYGLNEVGARVLKLIRQPRPISEIMEVLLQEYDVKAGQLEKELLAFLGEMEERQLIQVEDEANT